MEITIYSIVLLAFCILDIRAMVKAKQKKELFSYLSLTLIALTIGLLYLSNPYRNSISYYVLKLLGIEG